jgi:hypothetical protein
MMIGFAGANKLAAWAPGDFRLSLFAQRLLLFRKYLTENCTP